MLAGFVCLLLILCRERVEFAQSTTRTASSKATIEFKEKKANAKKTKEKVKIKQKYTKMVLTCL